MAECSWKMQDDNIHVQAVIPPNTTASVILPGREAEPLEVGSGTHRWSYEYRDAADAKTLSVDSAIGDLTANVRAWDIVINTLPRFVPQSDHVKMLLGGQSNKTLRQGLEAVPNAHQALAAIEEGLAKL
jgi:alpha-L-rhamnosidase